MKYVYFTKLLQSLDVPGLIAFFKETGLDGADMTVRPGFPVTPDNAADKLPEAVKAFRDAGLTIGLATAPTSMVDPDGKEARAIFEACGKAGVPAVKIGYFPYRGKFDAELKDARARMKGFSDLAKKTGVRACYHTHSGSYHGANCGLLRMLLQDLDPHHVGAFADTGHLAVNGAPIRLELDLVRDWLSLVAIKDMNWAKDAKGWKHDVVPAGEGIVRWTDVGKALKDCKFNGTVSLHGEYHTKDMDERKKLAKAELAFLKKQFA